MLSFAARCFYLAFQFYDELAYAWLIHRLDQPERFIENSSLMFRKVWQPGDCAQFSSIQSCARWTHTHYYFLIDCQGHRRNIGCLKRARNQRNGLMAQSRGRDQKCCLHFVSLDAFNEARNHLFNQPPRIGNETAATPKHRIKLADNAVALKLKQTTQG